MIGRSASLVSPVLQVDFLAVAGAAGMSGVGAAILEGQEHAQHESVRVYLSQSVLPAITEALTAMEKERCPNPVPHPFAALLDMHPCCAVPNDQPFGLRTSSRSFAIRRHKAETGWLRLCLCLRCCTLGSRRCCRVPHSSLLSCTVYHRAPTAHTIHARPTELSRDARPDRSSRRRSTHP